MNFIVKKKWTGNRKNCRGKGCDSSKVGSLAEPLYSTSSAAALSLPVKPTRKMRKNYKDFMRFEPSADVPFSAARWATNAFVYLAAYNFGLLGLRLRWWGQVWIHIADYWQCRGCMTSGLEHFSCTPFLFHGRYRIPGEHVSQMIIMRECTLVCTRVLLSHSALLTAYATWLLFFSHSILASFIAPSSSTLALHPHCAELDICWWSFLCRSYKSPQCPSKSGQDFEDCEVWIFLVPVPIYNDNAFRCRFAQ